MYQKTRENMLNLLADAVYLYPCTYTLIPILLYLYPYDYTLTPIPLYLYSYDYTLTNGINLVERKNTECKQY